ncbi:cache domain-containing sensor histidine kinase [Ferdinandcohnia quinoae]|uniref:Histidine kinase n=1 Tax=Fredinandcohnia quinoae TaxID=2918902 RepID=A0AAW5DYG0_9BACI|nr:sensor histidine kinase [Fredinandcohnia sp. SECRCQ15]MCH1624065.1 histidine kinase [Fredinandcohnia sp. SECRCQ15]
MKQITHLFQIFQLKRINHQIFVLMIITITIPLLFISYIIYLYSVQSVKSEYQTSSNLILNNLSFNIDQYLHSVETGTLNALMDDKLQNALRNITTKATKKEDFQNIQFQNAIEQFNTTIEMTIKNVDSVQIYVGNRVFYSTLIKREDFDVNNIMDAEWYKQTLQRKGGIVLLGTHKPFHRVNSDEHVISIARVINKKGTRDALGVLLIDIRLDSLREILNLSENQNRNFVILDTDGRVVYDSQSKLINSSLRLKLDSQSLFTVLEEDKGSFYSDIDGNQSFINFVTSPYSGWKVVQYTDEKEITKHADMLRTITLGSAFCSLITAILFMYFLSSRVTKPIIYLSKQVKLVGKGRFNVNLRSNRQDEFGVLFQGIRKMVTDIQAYIERSSILKAQQKIAQYRALKSQINPHFLANALESIQMKAVINKQLDISEMIGLLGRLFRSHIQTGKETVSLEEELEHTRLYVKVQQMRFGNKIQYIENIDAKSKLVRILHFSIQPLIENGIVHGIECKNGPGILEVSTSISGMDLLIKVRDNGVGMDETQLQQLRDRLDDITNKMDEAHIGIKNVHEQIRYYYGHQYGLEIYSRLHIGTTVIMRIPINE